VLRRALDRGGVAEQFGRFGTGRGGQRGHGHPAAGDGAGFVEHDRVDQPGRLERLVPLDEDAAGSLRVLFHRDTTSENDSPGLPRQGRAGAGLRLGNR
jgi:hypothetical protein